MIEIAKTYNVPFEPDPSVMAQDEIFAAENLLIEFDEKKGVALVTYFLIKKIIKQRILLLMSIAFWNLFNYLWRWIS
jgi:hypothetical protein